MTRDRLLQAIDTLGATGPATPADVRGLLRAVALSVPAPGLGVVREKSVLRTRIDAMFEDNTVGEITPAVARDVLEDMVDSLLDTEAVLPGAGITVSRSAGVVTIAAGGAAAATGLPSFVLTGAAQPSDDVLTATITGLGASPPFPSVVYMITPSGLNRAADDLELRVNGDVSRVRSLVDFRGDALAARDLDPAALYELLAHASPAEQYRLTEPIPLRRQDFDVVVFWSDGDGDPDAVTENSAVDTFDTPILTSPAYTGTRSSTAYFLVGVPPEAPEITVIASLRLRGIEMGFRQMSATERATFVGEIGGEPGRWYRSVSRQRFSDDQTFGEGAGIRLSYEYI